MQVKSIAECSPWETSAILLTFIKLPFVMKIFVLTIFEQPFNTGFAVLLVFDATTSLKGALTRYGKLTWESALAWNLIILCLCIVWGMTFI